MVSYENMKLPLGNTNFRSADMWGLGCLIWEVFNGSLQSPSSLKAIGKVLTMIHCLYAVILHILNLDTQTIGYCILPARRRES